MTYVDVSGVETAGMDLKCHWNGAWLGPTPGTCECEYSYRRFVVSRLMSSLEKTSFISHHGNEMK